MSSNSEVRKLKKNKESPSPSPKRSTNILSNSPGKNRGSSDNLITNNESKIKEIHKDKSPMHSNAQTHSDIDRSVFKKHLPKNVNTYRHIIDTMQSRDSDVEWILELRAYEKKGHYETLKESQGVHPNVYQRSLDDYRHKVEQDHFEKKKNPLLLKGNSQYFEHLMKGRIGMQANPTQLGFDSTLRSFNSVKIPFMNAPWKSVNLSPKKNLFNTYLPPMKKQSKENLEKLGDLALRPYEQVEEQAYLNGENVRRRRFIPSNSFTLKFAGEHNSLQPYSYKYPDKNVNSIRHLLGQQINSLGVWESDLRSYKKSKNNRYEAKSPSRSTNKAS